MNVIDYSTFGVSKDGQDIYLTRTEFNLLDYLYKHKGTVCLRDEVIKQVWNGFNETRVVDVYVGYLRKKLGKDAIKGRRGFGYMISKDFTHVERVE